MKSTTKKRLVIQYFLRKLEKKMETNKTNTIDKVFLNIYTKDDLLDIIKWLYDPTKLDMIKFNATDKEKILEAISDDYHILRYELAKSSEELEESTNVVPIKIFETIQQLGLQNHYLIEKNPKMWNEHDFKNYRDLLQKAGKSTPVFGIFDSSIKEKDKYFATNPAPEYFNTLEEAMDTLEKLIRDGELKDDEAKIMIL